MSDNHYLFTEQAIIGEVKRLLSGRVNEILHNEEFAMPVIELGEYQGDNAVSLAIALASCERTEKERIIWLDTYSLSITFTLPETFETETQCYGITAAVCMALKENPTLGGVADRAVVVGERYVPPKKPHCGEGWGVVISLRITVENQ
jgi:hypothetical protein